MKTNELMIGDWVLLKGVPTKIHDIDKIDGINREWIAGCEDGGCTCYEDIQPIPLTPEILEKNGFEDTICDAFWISTSCNLLWKDGKLQNFCREEDDEVCIPCEYVHELQNALRLCKVDKEIVL